MQRKYASERPKEVLLNCIANSDVRSYKFVGIFKMQVVNSSFCLVSKNAEHYVVSPIPCKAYGAMQHYICF